MERMYAKILLPLLISVLLATSALSLNKHPWGLTTTSPLYPDLRWNLPTYDVKNQFKSAPSNWRLTLQNAYWNSWGRTRWHYRQCYDLTDSTMFPVKYSGDDTNNKMESRAHSYNAHMNSLSFILRYDTLSYNSMLRGNINVDQRPPVQFERSAMDYLPIVGAISSAILIFKAILGVAGDISQYTVKPWNERQPRSGFYCSPSGFTSTVGPQPEIDEMRVYAPSTFASLMDWEVRNDSFLFYPKFGGTRWLMGVSCTFNGYSYTAQGDSIQINTHGGDGVCVFSLTAYNLEPACYFGREYSVAWLKDHGHMVKSWKSGEYAVAISHRSSKDYSLSVCQQNTNWLVAEMPEGSAIVSDFTSGKFYNPSDRQHTSLMGQSIAEREHYFRTCPGATTWCKKPSCPYSKDQYT